MIDYGNSEENTSMAEEERMTAKAITNDNREAFPDGTDSFDEMLASIKTLRANEAESWWLGLCNYAMDGIPNGWVYDTLSWACNVVESCPVGRGAYFSVVDAFGACLSECIHGIANLAEEVLEMIDSNDPYSELTLAIYGSMDEQERMVFARQLCTKAVVVAAMLVKAMGNNVSLDIARLSELHQSSVRGNEAMLRNVVDQLIRLCKEANAAVSREHNSMSREARLLVSLAEVTSDNGIEASE